MLNDVMSDMKPHDFWFLLTLCINARPQTAENSSMGDNIAAR